MLDPRVLDFRAPLFVEVLVLALVALSQRLAILDPLSRKRRFRFALAGAVPFTLMAALLLGGLCVLYRQRTGAETAPLRPALSEATRAVLMVLPLVALSSLVHFGTRRGSPARPGLHAVLWCAVGGALIPRPAALAGHPSAFLARMLIPLWLAAALIPFTLSFLLLHARIRPALLDRAASSRLDRLQPAFFVLILSFATLGMVAGARRASFLSDLDFANATVQSLRAHTEGVGQPGSLSLIPIGHALARLRGATGLDLGRDPVLWEAALVEARLSGRMSAASGERGFLARALVAPDPALRQHALVFLRSPETREPRARRPGPETFAALEPHVRELLDSSPEPGLRYDAAATLLRAYDVRSPDVLRSVLEVAIPARGSLLTPSGLRSVQVRRACVVDDLVHAALSLNRASASGVRDSILSSRGTDRLDVSVAIRILSDAVVRAIRDRSAPPVGPIRALASLGPAGADALRRQFLDYGPPEGDGENDPCFLALLDAVVRSSRSDRNASTEVLARSLLASARAWALRSPERAPQGRPASPDDPNLTRLVNAIADLGGDSAFRALASGFSSYAPQAPGDRNWLRLAEALRSIDPKGAQPILGKALLEHAPLSPNDSTYRSLLGFCLVPPWQGTEDLSRSILARYRFLGDQDENYSQIISTLAGLGGPASVPVLIDELLRERARAPGLVALPDPSVDPNREIVKKALIALGPKVSGPAVERALGQEGKARSPSPCEVDLVDLARVLGQSSALSPILRRMQAMSAADIRGRLARLYSAFANVVGEMGGQAEKAVILKERERVKGFSPSAREAERDLEMAAAKLISRHIIGPETTLAALKAFRPGKNVASPGRYGDMLSRTIRDAGPKSAYPVLLEELTKFNDVKNEDYGALVEAIGKVGGRRAEEVLLAELGEFRVRPALAEKDENVPGYRSLVRALALLLGAETHAPGVNEALLSELDRNEITRPALYDCVRSALQESGKVDLLERRSRSILSALEKGTVKESAANRFTLLKNAVMEGEWRALRPLLAILMTTTPGRPDDPTYTKMVDGLKELRLAGPRGDGPGPEETNLIATTLDGEREKFKDPPSRGAAFLHLLSTLMVFASDPTMRNVLQTSLAAPGQQTSVREGLQALIESLPEPSESGGTHVEEGGGASVR